MVRVTETSRAYHALERMIVTRELEPGSTTTEGALIAATGFGRTPVREAIQRLAWDGFLDIRPRLGLLVAQLEPKDWAHVLDVKESVETVLARTAARTHQADDRREFLAACEAMYRAANIKDHHAFLSADRDFDEALARAANNAYASRVAAPLQTHGRRFWFCYAQSERLEQSAHRHIAIVEAVLRGDADAAEAATKRLIDLLRLIQQDFCNSTALQQA